MLDAALWNARRGFRVFPLRPCMAPHCDCTENDKLCKKPAHKGWQQEATTDEHVIEQIWNGTEYNVGVACGDGLVVVDVDVKGGKRGFETFQQLGLPATYRVDTPSGGCHFYFRGDARNSASKLGEGVDVRGVGGYVVGAGSTIGARTYAPDFAAGVALAALPATAIPDRSVPAAAQALASSVTLDMPQAVDRATAYLLGSAPLAVEGQGGDHTTFVVAATIKDFGLSDFMAWELLAEHWNDRCSPPWPLEDLERKVRNAYAYGENPPGSSSLELDFGGVRIEPPVRERGVWRYDGDDASLDRRWLFHNLLEPTGVCLLVGDSGSGKTFLCAELARCVATGRAFFGIEPDERGSSLFLFAGSEGSGFGLRLRALGEAGRLPIAWRSVFNLRDRVTMESLAADLQHQKDEMMRRFAAPLKIVFLETFSASGLVEKENDNAQVAAALEMLSRLGAALGILFVVSHHPPKGGNGDDPRGGGALRASADYILAVHREGRESVRDLELTKGRNVPERRIGAFSLVEVALGADGRGRPVTSLAISMGEARTKVAESIKHLRTLMKAFELIEPADFVETGEGRFAYEDAWKQAFVEIDTSKERGQRVQRFVKTMNAAIDQGMVQRTVGLEGVAARPVTIGEDHG